MKRLLRSIPLMRSPIFRWAFLVGLAVSSILVMGAPPAWWAQREVLNGQPADDYALFNQGQLKNMAKKAFAELNSKLPGGAGPVLAELISGWHAPAAPGSPRDDFSAVNLGQLKNVAKPFYDRLIAAGYTTSYPWSDSTNPPDDFAAANLGQLKSVFNFDLTLYDSGDGLPSGWKIAHFGTVNVDPNADPDHDGLSNLREYQFHTDPNNPERADIREIVLGGTGTIPGPVGSVNLTVFSPLE